MNKHLNLFKTYAKTNRNFQLENDLTRALAICLQEDALFFHELIKTVIEDSALYNSLFEDLDGETDVRVEIQKQASNIEDFDRVYAVSLSESEIADFWSQTANKLYDPVCDLVVKINKVLIVIEAKRDDINCTAQLYNQILNIYDRTGKDINDYKASVSPVDLNWKKLMEVAVKVAGVEKATGNTNRFLTDFIGLVKGHNYRWLPETPIGSLRNPTRKLVQRRVETAVVEFCNDNESVERLIYKRLGTTFSKPWASEVLFNVDSDSGDLVASIYPGNTKQQGHHCFKDGFEFQNELMVDGNSYTVNKRYHIRLSGQRYITGLWLKGDNFLKSGLYTRDTFSKYAGRVKKANWSGVEKLLDTHIDDWKSKCCWQDKIINSNRTQFDLSFGYRFSIVIPYHELARLDLKQDDISPLAVLIESIYTAFEESLYTEVKPA